MSENQIFEVIISAKGKTLLNFLSPKDCIFLCTGRLSKTLCTLSKVWT